MDIDQHTSTQQEWGSLSHQIAQIKQSESLTIMENNALKEERDRYVEARAVAKAEAEAAEVRCKACMVENDNLRVEMEHIKSRMLETELQYTKTDAALTEAKRSKSSYQHTLSIHTLPTHTLSHTLATLTLSIHTHSAHKL